MKAGFSEFLRKGILGIAIFLMVTGAGKAAEREERMVFLVRDTLPDMGLPHLEGKVDKDSLLMGTDLALDTLTRAQKRLMKRRMETKPHSPHKATILAMVALFIFGGPALRDFSIAMTFAVVMGTFTSIYISNVILYHFNLRDDTISNGK